MNYVILSFFFFLPFIGQAKPLALRNRNENNTQIISIKKMHQLAPKVPITTLVLASNAYIKAKQLGAVKKPILTVIDYTQPSSEKRLWVFDVNKRLLLFNTFVAHGQKSGGLYATHFSNTPQSKESSIGTYVTQNTYQGGKGYSLNLKGLETLSNSNAFNRRIVMHGAWYVTDEFVRSHGRAGRSWGCPAISPQLAKPIINTIKNGSVIFGYYPDKNYLDRSNFTHVA